MKTAESLGRTIAQIQAIQNVTGANLQKAIIPVLERELLEALKEGMRRSAGIAHRHSLLAYQEILATAEQLSEKGL